MRSRLKKAGVFGLAALTIAASTAASVTPAAAQRWHRHGYWGPGWGWHRGYDWGGAVAAGVLGGLALGALAGSAYAYPYSYGGCYWQSQPAYDAWGNFMGYHLVEVCY
jgi:hypothetical protein